MGSNLKSWRIWGVLNQLINHTGSGSSDAELSQTLSDDKIGGDELSQKKGSQEKSATDKATTPGSEYDDLAFELATANEISEALPKVLRVFQQKRPNIDLYVLISHPNSAESFLHHGKDVSPPPHFIQELHGLFTLNKSPHEQVFSHRFSIKKATATNNIYATNNAYATHKAALENSLKTKPNLETDQQVLQISPKLLHATEALKVWFLLVAEQDNTSLNPRQWQMLAMETCLTKGIQAWFKREEKIKQALETERSIYAAELHDSVAQVLGYLRMKTSQLHKKCQQEKYTELFTTTEDLAAYTHCAYRQTRELIASSRLTLESDNLTQGVLNSIKSFEQQSSIVFELDNRLQVKMLSAQQTMQVLYIIRESLSNIVRHSHASHALIRLKISQGQCLEVLIEDNGTGVNEDKARSDSFGLQIMQERANRIGAHFNISNRAEGGCRVHLRLDLGD